MAVCDEQETEDRRPKTGTMNSEAMPKYCQPPTVNCQPSTVNRQLKTDN